MQFVTDAQRCISIFVSHSQTDNKIASYYEKLLTDEGFTVFQYGHGIRPGDHISNQIFDWISRCHFFLLIVSNDSLGSHWVQRELGLAKVLQEKHFCGKPIIIPIYAEHGIWRTSGRRPNFPIRNFETGKLSGTYKLQLVRGLDKYSSPNTDTDDYLISFMKPRMQTTWVDFQDEGPFHDTEVFELYKHLFDTEEQDDLDDIVNWVCRHDLGKDKKIILDNIDLHYRLDSRYFILSLAERAIGMAFTTFDYTTRLVFGNYIGVAECWRSGDIADAFAGEILKVLERLFPEYSGVVFEVQKVDMNIIRQIVNNLDSGSKSLSENDIKEIRKCARALLYEKKGCKLFTYKNLGIPLVATSPCLNPEEDKVKWKSLEKEYWIMWHERPGMTVDIGGHADKDRWLKANRCIYIEILAKSLVEAYSKSAAEYWSYANEVVKQNAERSQHGDIELSKFFNHDYRHLYRRLMAKCRELKIEIAI